MEGEKQIIIKKVMGLWLLRGEAQRKIVIFAVNKTG